MGLIKKAMELSLLCGNEILLIIHDPLQKEAMMYNSMENDIENFYDIHNKMITTTYSNKNV